MDESYPDTLQGEEIPLFIAREKAAAYQSMIGPEELLITADTIVWHEGKALGKPVGRQDAIEMLRSLSGKSHQVITGVCLTTREWQKCFAAVTDVRFAILDEDEIAYYVDHYQPMDKAGSYGVQEWIGFCRSRIHIRQLLQCNGTSHSEIIQRIETTIESVPKLVYTTE